MAKKSFSKRTFKEVRAELGNEKALGSICDGGKIFLALTNNRGPIGEVEVRALKISPGKRKRTL